MSYVRDNGLARARRRRERRSMAVLAFSSLLVLGAIVFAVAFMGRGSKPSSSACPSGASASVPETKKFVTNVYNAGGPKGAAGNAADALRTHDFMVGVVGNDPYKKTIKEAGEVRFGPEGKTAAEKYVAKYAVGAKLVQDGRDGNTVDVIVGPKFTAIQPAPETESETPTCDPNA